VFRQLQRLHLEVEGRREEWSPEAVDITDLHAGQLLTSLTDLRSLVHRRLQLCTTPAPPAVSSVELKLRALSLSRQSHLCYLVQASSPAVDII